MKLVNQTTEILKQGSELMKNPVISSAIREIFEWLKGILGKKSAKEKLELIEQNKYNEETIIGLKANLEFILEDNEDLQKQLSEKLKKVELLMEKTDVQKIIKTNTISITGNANIALQDITSNGNFIINKDI